jgi:hypothetical protein
MVSARTAAFFALIVACASQVFASPLPVFEREARDISPFVIIKAYERSVVSVIKRAGGIKAYGRRQVDDTADTTDPTDPTDTTGVVSPVAAPVAPANIAAPPAIITIPAEVAVSSDGTGPVPIRNRAVVGVNMMPADMATMSDGTAIKAYGRRRRQVDDTTDPTDDLADPTDPADPTDNTDTTDTTGGTPPLTTADIITIPAEEAVSSDGSGPVPIGKRLVTTDINMMPAEMPTTSDGTTMKAYGLKK